MFLREPRSPPKNPKNVKTKPEPWAGKSHDLPHERVPHEGRATVLLFIARSAQSKAVRPEECRCPTRAPTQTSRSRTMRCARASYVPRSSVQMPGRCMRRLTRRYARAPHTHTPVLLALSHIGASPPCTQSTQHSKQEKNGGQDGGTAASGVVHTAGVIHMALL